MEKRIMSYTSLDGYIGNRLRCKRQEKGMTLASMADKLSLNTQQIQKYETGQMKISALLLYRFSQFLGVTPNYFFEGAEDFMSCDLTDILVVDPHKPLTILMVEDNPVDESLFRSAMAQSGVAVTVLCIKDTSQAFDYLHNTGEPHPDLIVLNLDVSPHLCFLKEIKNDPLLMTLPVVVTTPSLLFSTMIKAYKAGASGYILKLFDHEDFNQRMAVFARYWSQVMVLPQRT